MLQKKNIVSVFPPIDHKKELTNQNATVTQRISIENVCVIKSSS